MSEMAPTSINAIFIILFHSHRVHPLAESQLVHINQVIIICQHRCWARAILNPINKQLYLSCRLVFLIILINLKLDHCPSVPLAWHWERLPGIKN